MPTQQNITGLRVVKNGQKSEILNLSNARRKSYAQLQQLSAAQKKGVIICPDYPLDDGDLIPAAAVKYGNTTVDAKLTELNANIAYKVVHTANAGQTYKAQLQELAPYVSALSTLDKYRSAILRGNQLFRYSNPIQEAYTHLAIDANSELIQCYTIAYATAVKREISGQTISGTDMTNTNDEMPLQFILIN